MHGEAAWAAGREDFVRCLKHIKRADRKAAAAASNASRKLWDVVVVANCGARCVHTNHLFQSGAHVYGTALRGGVTNR